MDVAFDTDSSNVGVDTCASDTMSGDKDLFEDHFLKDLGECKGVGGGLVTSCMGMLGTRMDYDNGRTRLTRIPNFFYVPNLSMTLLFPQHWAQQAATSHPFSSENMVSYTIKH